MGCEPSWSATLATDFAVSRAVVLAFRAAFTSKPASAIRAVGDDATRASKYPRASPRVAAFRALFVSFHFFL